MDDLMPGTELYIDYDGSNELTKKYQWINDKDIIKKVKIYWDLFNTIIFIIKLSYISTKYSWKKIMTI